MELLGFSFQSFIASRTALLRTFILYGLTTIARKPYSRKLAMMGSLE